MVTSGAAAVSEKPTATSRSRVTGFNRCYTIGLTDAFAEKGQRLVTATLSWRAIYTPHPGHLKFAGVPRSLIYIQEHLQDIQEQIDQILRLSTSFVSVSARISYLESVRARCCAL